MSDKKLDVIKTIDRLIGNTSRLFEHSPKAYLREDILEGQEAREAVTEMLQLAHMVVASNKADRWGDACRPIVEHAARITDRIGSES